MPSRRTSDAAQYLTDRGIATSRSLLEKLRCRGPDDPRGNGPDFYRDASGFCLYRDIDLDAYAEKRLGTLKFRARIPQPSNLRGGRRGAEAA